MAQWGRDFATSFRQHRDEADTIAESNRVAAQFSTYSDEEVRELIRKINGCRDPFIKQGSGADRARRICSIFHEIQDGNGGQLPLIDDWDRMFNQLKCKRKG